MEFIPGSHKWGVVPHEKDEYYLRIHDDYIKPVEVDAVRIEILPGDVVIFSNLLFHRGATEPRFTHPMEFRLALSGCQTTHTSDDPRASTPLTNYARCHC